METSKENSQRIIMQQQPKLIPVDLYSEEVEFGSSWTNSYILIDGSDSK